MDERLKQRMVGAAVLACVGVIGIPLLLGDPRPRITPPQRIEMSQPPSGEFASRIVPLKPLAVEHESESAPQPEPVIPRRVAATPNRVNPPPAKPTTSKPVSKPAAAPDPLASWVIRLGSFAKSANAMRLRDQLRDKGYTAYVDTDYSRDKPLTRVYVGPRLRKDRARATLNRLNKQTGLKGLVVRYPSG